MTAPTTRPFVIRDESLLNAAYINKLQKHAMSASNAKKLNTKQ